MQLRRTVQLAVTFLTISAPPNFPPLDFSWPMVPARGGGTANISLIDASATVTQIGDTAWTLDKSGSRSGNTVSWNIVATPVATTGGLLVVNGQMTVFNYGTGPATIGNIVVNLQKRVANKWVTKSSDIADATLGDAATTANIHKTASSENKSTFIENGAPARSTSWTRPTTPSSRSCRR